MGDWHERPDVLDTSRLGVVLCGTRIGGDSWSRGGRGISNPEVALGLSNMLGQCISGLACTLPSKSGRSLALSSSGGNGLGSGEGGGKGSIGSHHIGGGRPTRRGQQGRLRAQGRPARGHGGGKADNSGREEGMGRRHTQDRPGRGHGGGEAQRRPRTQREAGDSRREAGGARSGRPGFGSGRGGSVGGGSGHAGVEAGWRNASGGGSGHTGVESGQREAGGARSGRAGFGSGRGGAGAADPAMAEGGQPPIVTTPSPQGGGATGKGEEEAAGVEKVKTRAHRRGLAGHGGSGGGTSGWREERGRRGA
ncbi:hypothetical protein GUJ93_ZPchr0009g2097 [Zizania palustris]|uniref:Uncharacterized protein n=1 Tax=Zizania palustris TaxID=103762 RepID=A0A8J5REH3_ZIZPA|nr:hypothetical protein GUJ93_ZPchr0009g2097 [Zizania palustris]